MLISNQIRAARGLLRWSARMLAEQAGVHLSTVQRMERSQGPVGGNVESVRRVQTALERAGVVFLAEDDSPGVRLTRLGGTAALASASGIALGGMAPTESGGDARNPIITPIIRASSETVNTPTDRATLDFIACVLLLQGISDRALAKGRRAWDPEKAGPRRWNGRGPASRFPEIRDPSL